MGNIPPGNNTPSDSEHEFSDGEFINMKKSSQSVIVFDIDDTLCTTKVYGKPEDVNKFNPECLLIDFIHEEKSTRHLFIPYIKKLFEYLLGKKL
jgi:hypothetical protein